MEQVPPPLAAELPPLLTSPANDKSSRRWFCVVLSLCLALFLLDGLVSFADDSIILFCNAHGLSLLRGLLSFATLLMAVGGYALIGITPLVPKRLFLPIPMFFLVAMLVMFTLAIFWRHHVEQIAFAISGCELVLALFLVYATGRRDAGAPGGTRRENKFSWPLVSVENLGARGFSWRNFFVFVAANVFVLLPLVVVYVFFFSARAVNRYSEGFVALHPSGVSVQVRKYERGDGKVVELFPMAHIADASFYRQVSQAFPTNSVILMEGVSDEQNLLTNKITYKRMASALGLSEQKATFAPSRGEAVRADVDVGQFSPSTLDFLNLVMLFHSKGVTSENLSKFLQFTPPPGFEEHLWDDLLVKRNQHLLNEIEAHLQVSDNIMVPWGAAHMPGLAKEIQKSGFHLSETREFFVIRFGHSGKTKENAEH